MLTRQRCCAQALAHDTEYHGALIDDELCSAPVVLVVPHVAVFELSPLHLFQVEAPNYRHFVLCFQRYDIVSQGGMWRRQKWVGRGLKVRVDGCVAESSELETGGCNRRSNIDLAIWLKEPWNRLVNR